MAEFFFSQYICQMRNMNIVYHLLTVPLQKMKNLKKEKKKHLVNSKMDPGLFLNIHLVR